MSAEKQHWVFAYDALFASCENNVYARGPLGVDVWERYLSHASQLTVLARELPENKKYEAVNLSSTQDVDFRLCPSISDSRSLFFGNREVNAVVRDIVANSDGLVARLNSEYGLLAAYEAERAGKPWLAEVVSCAWDGLWNYGTWQGRAYAPIMMMRTRRAVARAPFVSYVTGYFLQRRYPNRIGQQINCSNVEIDTPSEAVLRGRLTRIESVRQPIKLGLIGTLKTRYKGIQTIFAALARVQHELPAVEFHVLGTGDATPWKEEAAAWGVADLVYFDDLRSPGAEVMAWLDDVDIYLQPSFQEGLPRATIEAMSRGCPALGSTCAGIPELLSSECLIKPGDGAHLARLLVHLIGNNEWQKREAEANWREAHKYTKDVLDARRNQILGAFAEAVSMNSR